MAFESALQSTLLNPDPFINASYGRFTAISENYIAIGAPDSDLNGADRSGAAYVYNRAGTLLYGIANRNIDNLSFWGYAIAIDETINTIAISAYNNAGAGSGGGNGSVYLYAADTGVFIGGFSGPNGFGDYRFGFDIAIKNNMIIVGEPGNQTGGFNSGRAHLYNATTRALLHTFPNPTPASGNEFGRSVAIDENFILIGEPAAGRIYVYENGGTYAAQREITAQGGSFCRDMEADNGRVVSGAPFLADVQANAGRAYLHDIATGNLLATYNNPAPTGADDQFGTDVAISGDYVIIGAKGDDDGASNSGAAYIFEALTATEVLKIPNPVPEVGAEFGRGVSIFGNTVVVGAPLQDGTQTQEGAAYVLVLGESSPQVLNLNITAIPDGTYPTVVVDPSSETVLFNADLAWTSGVAFIDLGINAIGNIAVEYYMYSNYHGAVGVGTTSVGP